MSIFGSFFAIEDEREWISNLQAEGFGAGVIRDGEPDPEDLDAPYVYRGSHILPERDDPQGGAVELASIAAHVRFWRETPDAPTEQEPDYPYEPFVRLSVSEHPTTPKQSMGDATVLLSVEQAQRLVDALTDWIIRTEEE
jgi:hypothetical protein